MQRTNVRRRAKTRAPGPWIAALLTLAPCVGCATGEPLRVEYTAAGTTGDTVWFVEERGTHARRQYVVLCHAERTPPCARVLPRSVRTPDQVRRWIATTATPAGAADSERDVAAALPRTPRAGAAGPTGEAGAGRGPPASATGTVAVITPGGWANVYTSDGRFLGQTPLSTDLPPGRHTLTLRPFGQPVEGPPTVTVEVRAGATSQVTLGVEGYR